MAFLLALALTAGLLPTAALASETECKEQANCPAETHEANCPAREVTRAELAGMLYENASLKALIDAAGADGTEVSFSDIDADSGVTEEQKIAIEAMAKAGILSGTAEGAFDPGGTVTRADLAVVFWRSSGSKGTGVPAITFSDVLPNAWYAPAVAALAATGLVNGTEDHKFEPTKPASVAMVQAILERYDAAEFAALPDGVTRAEMAVAAYERYQGSPYAQAVEEDFTSKFNDLDGCSEQEKDAIWFLEKNGIVQGENKPDGNGKNPFNPDGPASNLQIAAFLMRCAKLEDKDAADTQSLRYRAGGDEPTADEVLQNVLEQIKAEFGNDSEITKMVTANPTAPAADGAQTTLADSIQVAAPVISFAEGEVTIKAAEGAAIYYTTAAAGGEPADPTVAEEQAYTDETEIQLSRGMTVKAVAVQHSLYSEVASATYKMTITPGEESLSGGDTVTLTVANAPDGETVIVTCSTEGITPEQQEDGTWSVTLPNADGTYEFTAAAGEETATCTVTVSRRAAGGSSGSTTTTTERNPDGSTTTTTTNRATGTVTETTRYPDGSRTVVETKKDGTVTTTSTDAGGNQTKVVENPDGSSETTVDNADGTASVTAEDRHGRVTVTASLPASVVRDAGGAAVPLSMPAVRAERDRDAAPSVTVDLPGSSEVLVEIPVENVSVSTVAVLLRDDGTEEILQAGCYTENGVAVPLSDGDTVKIVDNGKQFLDVPDAHWGAEAIDFVASRELFGGTGGGMFSPETAMSRGMLVTVLARLEDVDTDAGETWYAAGRQWAMECGISDGTRMDQALTREQMAVMLWRYAGSPLPQSDLRGFADAGSVSAYAADAMAWAVEQGLIGGTAPSRLDPQGQATRAQVSAVLMRYCQGSAG